MYNLGAIAASGGNKAEAKKRWEDLIIKFPNSEESKLAENSLKKL
jgi:TolA-binding protein